MSANFSQFKVISYAQSTILPCLPIHILSPLLRVPTQALSSLKINIEAASTFCTLVGFLKLKGMTNSPPKFKNPQSLSIRTHS